MNTRLVLISFTMAIATSAVLVYVERQRRQEEQKQLAIKQKEAAAKKSKKKSSKNGEHAEEDLEPEPEVVVEQPMDRKMMMRIGGMSVVVGFIVFAVLNYFNCKSTKDELLACGFED